MPSLSMVVPAFNEEEILEPFIHKAMADMAAVSSDFEMVLVDDGSTDRTPDIARRLAQQYPQLKIVSPGKNLGTGGNFVVGFAHATKEWVFPQTVDAFFDTRDLPLLIQHLGTYDVVSGYRTDLEANNLYQKLLTTVNRGLIRALFPLKLQAYQTVQFHRKWFFDQIRIEARSSFVSPELLLKAHFMGMKIKEVPIKYHPRTGGTAKGGKLKHVLRSLKDIGRAYWKYMVLRQVPKSSQPLTQAGEPNPRAGGPRSESTTRR